MKLRQIALVLHRYLGAIVGILLAIVSLTGSSLVFSKEINVFLNPQMFQVIPQGDRRVSIQFVLETIRSAYPDWQLNFIELPRTLDSVYTARMLLNSGGFAYVYLNPYTGEVLGFQQWGRTVMSFIYNIHVNLLAGKAGEIIVGICGVMLLLLSVTGIILWPGWKKLVAGFAIRWRSSAQLINYDIHKVGGILSGVFLIAIASTGTAMIFHTQFNGMIYSLIGTPKLPELTSTFVPNSVPISADIILQKADLVLPGKTIYITFPRQPQGTFVVRKKLAGDIHPNGSSNVYLDRHSGKVLRVENGFTAPLASQIINLLFPVHIGAVAGLTTRILYVFIGLTPTLLSITGLLIWRRRQWKLAQRREASRQINAIVTEPQKLSPIAEWPWF
ncbi:PepSY-associated TM helix domain-containing protein [Kamptonema sp. UHCC 0994]|uniref:PepSY-associated TM helix domain-containing protein n=1 Tax=Kamptonema sp. UHCC 0994 TaxID=3031329 RepID=UPI0023B9FE5E|nr:PepSY-associated TM helix domain-containing protein [Kamptonema sp. UHCC 0994]MDF0552719.1 PepSY-associated TM helix domain-containing protein [Kamptonema sp. UHCC 0994]